MQLLGECIRERVLNGELRMVPNSPNALVEPSLSLLVVTNKNQWCWGRPGGGAVSILSACSVCRKLWWVTRCQRIALNNRAKVVALQPQPPGFLLAQNLGYSKEYLPTQHDFTAQHDSDLWLNTTFLWLNTTLCAST